VSADRPGEVIVPVMLGTHGPYRFLLDTGSTHTAIRSPLRKTLGAAAVAQTVLKTSVGSVSCLVVQLPALAVGAALVEGLAVTVLPDAAATVLGQGVDGIVGQDFLSKFNYTVDYRRSLLIWNDTQDGDDGFRLKLIRSGERYLVELPQGDVNQAPVRLVPDSGADVIVLFGHTNAMKLATTIHSRHVGLSSLAGGGTGLPATVALRVGTTMLRQEPAVVVQEEASGEDGDGLLPLHAFRSVSFNNRDGYMLIRSR
jgi:predicted aspartyl protease